MLEALSKPTGHGTGLAKTNDSKIKHFFQVSMYIPPPIFLIGRMKAAPSPPFPRPILDPKKLLSGRKRFSMCPPRLGFCGSMRIILPTASYGRVLRLAQISQGHIHSRRRFSPLGNPARILDSSKMSMALGSSYALYSNGDADIDHDNLIVRMNTNFTNVEEVVYTFFNFDLEAPNILYTGKRYYILMSHKTGYRPNNVVVFSAEKLAGPWSVQSYISELGTRTWNSQSTLTITAGEGQHKTYIYGGDQWATGSDLYDSRYVWLPAKINDNTGSFRIDWHDLYSIDAKTGQITYPKGQEYEAEEGTITGIAYVTLCPTCSGSKVVTGIEGNATVTIKNIVGTGQPQWVSVYYHNPDGLWGDNRGGVSVLSRTATFSVNGGVPVSIRQRSGSSGIILSQPLNVTFNEGRENTLTFAGFNGGAASDLDKIIVYGNVYED